MLLSSTSWKKELPEDPASEEEEEEEEEEPVVAVVSFTWLGFFSAVVFSLGLSGVLAVVFVAVVFVAVVFVVVAVVVVAVVGVAPIPKGGVEAA